MDTILIATDFDTVSHNAGVYGTALANAYHGKVILCNAFDPLHAATGSGNLKQPYDYMMQADTLLLKEAHEIDPDKKCVDILCDEGEAPGAIMEMAFQEFADLVIIGLRSMPPAAHKSTAAALAENARKPVLMVPLNAKFTPFTNMLFIQTRNSGSVKNITDQIAFVADDFDSPVTYWVSESRDDADEQHTTETLQHIIDKCAPDCIVMIDPGTVWLTAICRYGQVPLLVLPKLDY